MLTHTNLVQRMEYFPETGLLCWRPDGVIATTDTKRGYKLCRIFGKTYQAHRLIWLYVHGNWPVFFIDHINGNPSDNRIANLRDVPQSENLQNQRKAHKNSKSGLLGVTWDKQHNSWKARIMAFGVDYQLGMYKDKYQAHQAYILKKRELHPTCEI
jgi:HNH endonuclease